MIFLSDNGPISGWRAGPGQLRYNAGLRDQKFSVYEGGVRTVCYWHWPDRWQPGVRDALGAHIDVVPTLCDLLAVPRPAARPWDGVSLLPLLDGQPDPQPDRLYVEQYALETLREPAPQPGGMVRQGLWKMVNGNELYHLGDDPGEQHNLAATDPGRLAALNDAYRTWWEALARERGFDKVPVEVGHRAAGVVSLQPHHGVVAAGDLSFLGKRGIIDERIGSHPSGVDGDWVSGWQRRGDRFVWEVEVAAAGVCRIGITARGAAAGTWRVICGTDTVAQALPAAADWQAHTLGTCRLSAGPLTLTLELPADLPTPWELRSLDIEPL